MKPTSTPQSQPKDERADAPGRAEWHSLKQSRLAPSSLEGVRHSLLPGSTSGLELDYPARTKFPPAWLGHIPFAFWLIEVVRPRTLVELGVHSGNSYCAMLQSVRALGLETRCFGIDTWRGDGDADFYPKDVFNELRAYHDANYASFSTLLRTRFDDALPYFADGSVDLLHIDRLHSYDSVRQNFNNWLPKLSPRGIVLLHDTNMREEGFGVWQFFEEVSSRYATFEFVHLNGLGVVYVGTEMPSGSLQALFATKSDADIGRVRAYFARLGVSVLDRHLLHEAEASTRGNGSRAGEVGKLEQELLVAKVALADAVSARDAAHRMSRLEVGLVGRLQREAMMQFEAIRKLKNELVSLRRQLEKRSARPKFLRLASSFITPPLRAIAARVRAARRGDGSV
jgi:O-antigen biosynthesis protein